MRLPRRFLAVGAAAGRQWQVGTKRLEGCQGRTEVTGKADRHAKGGGGGGLPPFQAPACPNPPKPTRHSQSPPASCTRGNKGGRTRQSPATGWLSIPRMRVRYNPHALVLGVVRQRSAALPPGGRAGMGRSHLAGPGAQTLASKPREEALTPPPPPPPL